MELNYFRRKAFLQIVQPIDPCASRNRHMTNGGGVGSTSDINTFDHNLNWSSAGGKDLSSDMIDSSDSEWLCQLSHKKTQKYFKI